MSAMRSFVLVTAVCGAMASPCLAESPKTDPLPGVQFLVERHNKAFDAQDLEGVMATYSSSPGAVLLGTGAGEAYLGGEGISAAYAQFFTKFKPNSISFSNQWISTGASGNIAWFAMTTTMKAPVDQETRERAFNMSGTLQKEKGQWRFVSVHFSRLGAE